MTFNINNKLVLVTGAASGIGNGIVLKCLAHGATVIGCDKDYNKLKQLETSEFKRRFFTYSVDVSKSGDIAKLFKNLEDEKLIPDAIVNNAGVYLGKSLESYTEKDIEGVLCVNTRGPMLLSQYFAKYKKAKKEKGIIINMASVSGQGGSFDEVYGASKAALIGLTKSCAISMAPYIRVNAIAPGLVDTPMMKIIPEERVKHYKSGELLEETITPDDIANTVLFLLSDMAKHYTGAVFDINNGCYLRS